MQQEETTKKFSWREVLTVFRDLPRVLRLVWDASPPLVAATVGIMLLQGIMPLATVIISRLLIDGALQGIARGSIEPIVLPIILQLVVALVNSFCARLSATLQILINHRLSDHMTLLILHKTGTLDLSFFEDAEFYDRLNQVRQDIASKPLMMVVKLSSLGSSLITMLSLFGLLFQLSWWLALVALIVPVPLFLADSRYGLNNYWMSFWQSPRKRQQFSGLCKISDDGGRKHWHWTRGGDRESRPIGRGSGEEWRERGHCAAGEGIRCGARALV